MKSKILMLILLQININLFGQANQNVGIGTTDPKANLHLFNESNIANAMYILGQGNSPSMLIKPNGSLSFGNETPSGLIHIETDKPGVSLISMIQNDHMTPVGFSMSNSKDEFWHVKSYISNTGIDGKAYWKLDYLPQGNVLTIRGNGNVGIKKFNPLFSLDITGSLELSGRFLPNNLAGNENDILVSDGSNKPSKWISLVSLENQKNILNKTFNSGSLTNNTPTLIASQSFTTNDISKVAVSFGTYVGTPFDAATDVNFGQIDVELWNVSTNTILDKFQTYFKSKRQELIAISANKVFYLNHIPIGTLQNYEIRCKVIRNEGSQLSYGQHGLLIASPIAGHFLNIKVLKR